MPLVSPPTAHQAWFGWPDVPKIEELRVQFSGTTDEAKRKQLAGEIQQLVIDEGVLLPMGQYFVPGAFRKNLTGMLDSPAPLFWNIKKSAS